MADDMTQFLSRILRNQLAKTVQAARRVGEIGARQAIQVHAVDLHEPHDSMSSAERVLRRWLRVHGRQLGDRREPKNGTQEIEHLTHEVAFEHWHRMLFARFLAEKHLLIEPDSGVTISLAECEELARERDQDRWTLAGGFAERMLPRIFRPDTPALQVKLAPENEQTLERLVESLPAEVFAATDSLGWAYQFWQSEKKNEVNRSGLKIGAAELPPVTQLFTEPYMVRFLLDNGLGAWWAAHRLDDVALREASSEDELRRNAAVPGVSLDYLRFVRHEDTLGTPKWHIASGNFDRWPEHLAELKILDPCCGSGHFLVTAFSMLVPMRIVREHLTPRAAVDAVLRENLHGLELDPRCVELAAFALALAAWTYPDAGGYRALPELNLACSGLAPNTTKEQWLALVAPAAAATEMPTERKLIAVQDSVLSTRLRNSLETLYDLFAQAPTLGSLINPNALGDNLFESNLESMRSLLATTLKQERTTEEQAERAVAAQGMARAAELLIGRYHWVVTNVPYLARSKHDEILRDHCEQHYATAKNDLATVFLERCLELSVDGGTISLVLPQNWLFLTSYRKLREKLLSTESWHLLARLGPGAFGTISGEVVKAILLTLTRFRPADYPHDPLSEASSSNIMFCLDVSESRTAGEKAKCLNTAKIMGVEQKQQLGNPDSRVVLGTNGHSTSLLNVYSSSLQGLSPADSRRFGRFFFELPAVRGEWCYWQSTVKAVEHYGGREWILRFGTDLEQAVTSGEAYIRGRNAWGKLGVVLRQIGTLPCALYSGEKFDTNCAILVPNSQAHLSAIWCFCSSSDYNRAVRRIDQKLNVTNSTLVKIPFDLDQWTSIALKRYPNGLPLPYSDDPTQWIFHGNPCGSVVWDEAEKWTAKGALRTDPTVLQVAVARVVGYRWPTEQDSDMELAAEQRDWVRHSEGLRSYADEDGIVCIPSVRGEPPAWERLLRLVSAAFGDAWNDGVLSKLLSDVGSPDLDGWLRIRFFDQHCKLFRQRPFIWHIWDGRRKDGFHALVNYHKLAERDGKGRRCLESLTYSYLGDWINRQRDGVKRGEDGAEGRLVAALNLQNRLVAILEGEPPFDIFVRWKSIDQQPIGWEPDINDGVRLNIRPFMAEDIPGGRRGAGILRTKPKIHWRKDRGKEPVREREAFPWFWSCPGDGAIADRTDFSGGGEFDGNRWNNLHYTNATKKAARARLVVDQTEEAVSRHGLVSRVKQREL